MALIAWRQSFRSGLAVNRDRGEPHGSSPPTPPDIRVTYTAVRCIERPPVPAGGAAAEAFELVSPRGLVASATAFGLHPSSDTEAQLTLVSDNYQRETIIRTCLFTVQAFRCIAPPSIPSADFCAAVRPPCDALSRVAATRRRSPEVRLRTVAAHAPDLHCWPLMDMDFAISCPLVRPALPRIRFLFVAPRL